MNLHTSLPVFSQVWRPRTSYLILYNILLKETAGTPLKSGHIRSQDEEKGSKMQILNQVHEKCNLNHNKLKQNLYVKGPE